MGRDSRADAKAAPVMAMIGCPDICAFCGEPIREEEWFMIQGALSDRVILLHRADCAVWFAEALRILATPMPQA